MHSNSNTMNSMIVGAAAICLGAIATSGCMMMGMGGGMMGSDAQQQGEEKERIIKEMMFGDYRIVAEFPPLRVDEESILLLHIHSRNDSLSTAAAVRVIVSLGEQKDGAEHVLLEEVGTPRGHGEYEYFFTPHEEGYYRLSFLVEQLDDSPLREPLILSATQEVKTMENSMGNMEQKTSPISPLLIVGGAAMVAMMIVMLGVRHF